MNQSPSFDELLRFVLADTALLAEERSALELVFGTLSSALSVSTSSPPNLLGLDPDAPTLDDLSDCGESAMSTPLSEQSESALVALLQHHVESASTIVEILQQRPIDQQYRDPLLQLELQLIATSINVEVLQGGVPPTPARRTWRQRLSDLMLYEFDFINRWFR